MNCAVHADREASGFCRNCGKALCPECTRNVRGVLYCENCLAGLVSKPQPTPGAPSPRLAMVLGWVPGLGAVYNGEYMKALIHVVIFAGLIALLNTDQSVGAQVMLGILLGGFVLYMPFEAFHTAKAKALGVPAPNLFAGAGAPAPATRSAPGPSAPGAANFAASADAPAAAAPRAPGNWLIGPAILILLGAAFLLGNLGLLPSGWLDRGWPLILIVIGGWLLWRRLRPSS